MVEPKQNTYRVLLHDGPLTNDLGEMTETEMYGYVRTKVGMEGAEDLLAVLEKKGETTIYFEQSLGPQTRVEIRRIESPQ